MNLLISPWQRIWSGHSYFFFNAILIGWSKFVKLAQESVTMPDGVVWVGDQFPHEGKEGMALYLSAYACMI